MTLEKTEFREGQIKFCKKSEIGTGNGSQE